MVDKQYHDILESVINEPLVSLLAEADSVRKEHYGTKLEICGIINAKSGACGEDCKFCAQSVRYNTEISSYPLIRSEDIINKAKRVKELGADRFGIVTSGNTLNPSDVREIAEIIESLVKEVGVNVCGSFGALDTDSLKTLVNSGMTRYHHNIETSRNFYPGIVSTHKYDDRLVTIRRAKDLGLEVCSGGILGLGENWEDRMEMALTLKQLGVDSVPLNFLIPIKGTPMGTSKLLAEDEALRIIVLFRMILENISIKVAAGREAVLRQDQRLLYSAGANGMLVGGYLTVPGRSAGDDLELINQVKSLWKIS